MPENRRLDSSDPQQFQVSSHQAKSILKAAGLIIFPTDTFYGLGADPFSAEAIRKIFQAKNRAADKALLVLIAEKEDVPLLTNGEIPPIAKTCMDAFWPGPLTLLFEANKDLPRELTAGTGKIGLRLPGNADTRKLISDIGHPITAPSANLSGEKEPESIAQIADELKNQVDLILDSGLAPGGKPSTVLDTTQSPPVLLRQGAVSSDRIESAIAMQCALPA
jgi:L-threonylcarbamoyladenylate synthase